MARKQAVRYPVAEPDISAAEIRAVSDAVRSGWVSSKGRYITQFEEGLAKYVGTSHGVSTSNGTTALHLAVKALGIGKGDRVIVPNLTFASPANAVIYEGAEPVLCDVEGEYWNLDDQKLEELIDRSTKAIIAVHLYGNPCRMDRILKIAREHSLFVIEDVAEALGSEFRNRRVGSFGDISCFSFYGNKVITTGEGGMCLTNNSSYAERMRVLRDHGMNPQKRYWHDEVGYNYRMTNMQAALGVAQLRRLDGFIRKKRNIASWYSKGLRHPRIRMVQHEPDWGKSIYWLYSILCDVDSPQDRSKLMERLLKLRVESRPLFYPLDQMPPYRRLKRSADLEVSHAVSASGLSLPSYTELNREDVLDIADAVVVALGT